MPVRAVLFDCFKTLADTLSIDTWLDAAWRRLGRPGTVRGHWPGGEYERRVTMLTDLWGPARRRDPDSRRDLSPARHRQVFTETLVEDFGVDPEYTGALYDVRTTHVRAYDGAESTLDALRRSGIRIAVVSNTGHDIRTLILPARPGTTRGLEIVSRLVSAAAGP